MRWSNKRNKRKRQHDQDTVFKKIQKATSIVLIFLNKGILPFVVSEVFLMFTQITISSSISSTSLFIVTRFCHTRFPIYSNNMQFKWNFNATQILTGIVSYINIVSQLWQLAMFKILLKRDLTLIRVTYKWSIFNQHIPVILLNCFCVFSLEWNISVCSFHEQINV